MKDRSDQLLNIKQAASLLNVSEVSLRRWTRSGKVACLRVGPKRERRFRLEDLHAFLEREGEPARAGRKRPAGPGAPGRQRAPAASGGYALVEGVSIWHGSHVCLLYESDLGRVKLAVPLLAEGLERGDLCFLVASGPAKAHILGSLAAAYRDVEREIGQRNLVVSDGAESGEAMYDYFHEAFVEGTLSGGRVLRVVGDMAWTLDRGLAVGELIEFELRYNQFLAHRSPVVSVCQYDARRFSGVAILDALKCHEDTFDYPLRRFLC